jgi:transposase
VTRVICGVDVSSTSLEAFVGSAGPGRSFANSAEGIAELAVFCQEHGVELVALEATGGYEKKPFALLWAQGVRVTILNPRAVRDFAKGMGLLEKTDAIDARIIARFAEVKGSAPCVPLSAQQEHLKALVTHLRQLTQMLVSQRNQGSLVTDKTVRSSIATVVKVLVTRKLRVAAKIAAVVASDPMWQQLDQAFRSIKGVADRTVAAVVADMPEIGTLSNKAVAKLAGLAPLARDSGKKHGKRPVRGGRRQLRAVLFVVASVVARHNPDFAAFQQRLSVAGKAKKVIRVALAHKLLVRLNAKARDVRLQFAAANAVQIA